MVAATVLLAGSRVVVASNGGRYLIPLRSAHEKERGVGGVTTNVVSPSVGVGWKLW